MACAIRKNFFILELNVNFIHIESQFMNLLVCVSRVKYNTMFSGRHCKELATGMPDRLGAVKLVSKTLDNSTIKCLDQLGCRGDVVEES